MHEKPSLLPLISETQGHFVPKLYKSPPRRRKALFSIESDIGTMGLWKNFSPCESESQSDRQRAITGRVEPSFLAYTHATGFKEPEKGCLVCYEKDAIRKGTFFAFCTIRGKSNLVFWNSRDAASSSRGWEWVPSSKFLATNLKSFKYASIKSLGSPSRFPSLRRLFSRLSKSLEKRSRGMFSFNSSLRLHFSAKLPNFHDFWFVCGEGN